MQYHVNIVWRNVRRNMHQSKFQSFAPEIHNQRPIVVPIAIPAYDGERRPYRFQVHGNGWLADIAQMPDLIRLSRKINNLLRQLVMRISKNKNFHTWAQKSSNHQIPSSTETSSSNAQNTSTAPLEFGIWTLFGAWNLGFGFVRRIACFNCVGNF